MKLGWMRISYESRMWLPQATLHDTVLQSDELGFDHLHTAQPNDVDRLPASHHLQIGLDLSGFPKQSPRSLITAIRSIYDRLEGRVVLRLPTGPSATDRSALQSFETMFADQLPGTAQSDFPMQAPRPDLLVVPRAGTAPDVSRAAANGFHALSPVWQGHAELARHWPAIVAGATHSKRRVCPSQWHLARLIFVSDDRAAVAAYHTGPARFYLRRLGLPDTDFSDLVIAGPAQDVAQQLQHLRKRVGPFGTLHCVDPGLSPSEAAQQRVRIITQVRPALQAPAISTPKQLERT